MPFFLLITPLYAAAEVQDRELLLPELIKQVEILQAYEQDFADALLVADVLAGGIQKNPNIESARKNIQACKDIISSLSNLQNKETDVDTVLRSILMARMGIILKRKPNTETFMGFYSEESSAEMLYGPTNPEIYPFLTEIQQYLAIKATNTYQMLNRVIVGLTKMVDLRMLTIATKHLLRVSPHICSLIENQSTDLGHPDETFVLGENPQQEMRDYEYWILGTNELKRQRATSSFESQELPYPDFLKPLSVKVLRKSQKNNTKKRAAKKVKKTALKTALVDASGLEARLEVRAEDTTEEAEVKMESEPVAAQPSEDHLVAQQDKRAEVAAEVPPPREEIAMPIRPRGAIERQSAAAVMEPERLSSGHTKIQESLFNSKQFQSVPYRDLATLWRRINGVNSIRESSGGSHKELLDRDGRVISGIYAHNANQTYGKHSIKFIRDAFIQIGYGLPIE